MCIAEEARQAIIKANDLFGEIGRQQEKKRFYVQATEPFFTISDEGWAKEWQAGEALTIEMLKETIDLIPKCPFKTFMESKKCSPNDGWVLLLPSHLRDEMHGEPPEYVQFNNCIFDSALLIKRPEPFKFVW